MLKIDKDLFQWEKGRYLIVNDNSVTTVEFYNAKSKNSIEVSLWNGRAVVPSKLLKEALPITALAIVKNESESRIIFRDTFKVLARPKPESYVDEDEPVDPDAPDPGPIIPDSNIIFDGGVVE